MRLTHGSLFAGIGGFDLGFERAGIETVWQVEIDEYCRKVLARHFPNAQRFSDIRECGGYRQYVNWDGTGARNYILPQVDILSGGFPCQDISNAGKRAGIDGERSGLWAEYARIIRELRPRYVVVENVAALLGQGMERVLGDLAACGYDSEWQSIRASDVGAPHIRERIWIVAYSDSCGSTKPHILSQQPRGAETIGLRKAVPDSEGNGMEGRLLQQWRRLIGQNGNQGYLAYANLDGLEAIPNHQILRLEADNSRDAGYFGASSLPRDEWWEFEPDVGRVAHGVPARVDRLRGLGNAIVPQIAEWIGRRIVESTSNELER